MWRRASNLGSEVRRDPAWPAHWARAAQETPLSRFVPFSSLVSAHDVITRAGDFLRVWRLDGIPFECADDETITDHHEALCGLLRNLAGGQFSIWTHRLHRRLQDHLSEPRQPEFARDLAEAYGHLLDSEPMMSNELYLTLLYRPLESRLARALTRSTKADIGAAHAEALREMEERSALISRSLRGFSPALLGIERRGVRDYSLVAEFLGFVVNGRWQPVPVHSGPLYRTLPTTRLLFAGDKLELRCGNERRFAAFLDIQEYADTVEPGVLDALLYERSEFIETQSFSILPRREAVHGLELQRDQLIASDDVVESQIAAMDVALDLLGDGQFCMGEYHYSLLVFGADVRDAGRRAARAMGAVAESSGMQMRPVDLVADAAWFAQMPGNWQWRPRAAKLSSRAFAALASGHNFSRGKRNGNPWGEALALLKTPSGQPFYLNLHASPEDDDSHDKKLPGNTLVLGSTGVGKTTLVMFLLAMSRKWNPAPRFVLFDLDRGSEIAVRALGGRYFKLEAGTPTGCNPFQHDPSPNRIQFWEQLVQACLNSATLPLLPADQRAIADAVKAVASMPRRLRRLSTVRQNLPKSGVNSLHDRLGRWCEDGALGWVFDQAEDRLGDLRTASVIGFDTTDFLELPEVRTPVMLYLLDVLEELIDGERLIYSISEFWKALDNPMFSEFAKQKQKTIRKRNGLGIFDTQSPSDVLRHDIGRTMVEQSVTKIFLANPAASRDEYVDGFGLSHAEFDIVRGLSARPTRTFLVKQGHSSAICELDLADLDDFVTVLSGSTDNVALLDEIRGRVGDEPAEWLSLLQEAVRARKVRSIARVN